jgi:pimeloyl-ACP methyl ester carboxylesterase
MTFFYILFLVLAAAGLLAIGYWLVLRKVLSRASDADEIFEVTTDDLWKLRLYHYRTSSRPNEPVLLVHSALANHRNFTSPAQSNLVKTLTERGYDCWLLELRGTRSSDPPHGKKPWEVVFDDYVLHDLPAAVDAVTSLTGHEQVHYVGHSLGGMALYAYCLTHPDPGIASAATLGAPPGFVTAHFRPSYTLLGFYKTFPRFSENCLRALTPLLKLYKPCISYLPINWHNMHEDLGIADYFNMLDSQPPQVVSQLAYWAESGTWYADHSQLDIMEGLRTLKLPLLAIFGQDDPLIPQQAAREFFEALPTEDKELIVLGKEDGYNADYNHCDLAFGRNAEQDVFEPVAAWFAGHPIISSMNDGERVMQEKPVNKRKKAAMPKPSQEALGLPEGYTTIPETTTDDIVMEATPEPVEPEEITPEVVTPLVVIAEHEAKPHKKAVTRKKTTAAKAKAEKPPAKKKAVAKKAPAKKKAATTAKKPVAKRNPSAAAQGEESD